MTTPYSQDLRDRVLAAYDGGMKTKQVTRIFKVSPAWARRINQRRRESGETTARPMGLGVVIKVDRSCLAELVHEHPDATLAELRERLGIRCGLSTIWNALNELGLSFKKRRFTLRSRIDQMSSRGENPGVRGLRTSTQIGLFSSMKRGPGRI